jgi:hypothetical protein
MLRILSIGVLFGKPKPEVSVPQRKSYFGED